MRLIVFIKKKRDFIELDQIILNHHPSSLIFCYLTNKKIKQFVLDSQVYFNRKYSKKFKNIKNLIFDIDNINNKIEIYKSIKTLFNEKCLVALPVSSGKIYTDLSKIIKKKNNTLLIHISDGILDSIPLYKYYFIFLNKKNLKNFLYSIILYFRIKMNLADECYSIFSDYSAFSKSTKKIKVNFDYKFYSRKILFEFLPDLKNRSDLILLIPTKSISDDDLISFYNLKNDVDKIIILYKSGRIKFKNKIYDTQTWIVGEDLLQSCIFNKIYSGPSTLAFYGKMLFSNIDIKILSNVNERLIIGSSMDNFLKEEAIKFGIEYEFSK